MNEQNWQDQLGEPKFEEEGLLHRNLFFKKNIMKMSLSKLHKDVLPLEYSTEQQMSILCVIFVGSFSNIKAHTTDI